MRIRLILRSPPFQWGALGAAIPYVLRWALLPVSPEPRLIVWAVALVVLGGFWTYALECRRPLPSLLTGLTFTPSASFALSVAVAGAPG